MKQTAFLLFELLGLLQLLTHKFTEAELEGSVV